MSNGNESNFGQVPWWLSTGLQIFGGGRASQLGGALFAGRLTEEEQEEWDRYVQQQERTASEAQERLRRFHWGPGPAGGRIGAVQQLAGGQLGEAERFYGGAPQRFEAFAQPVRRGLAGISGEARGRLGELEAGYAGLERRGMAGAAELVGGFRGLETEGRAGAADLVRRQEARERGLLGQLEGLGGQERRDIIQAYGAEGAAEQVRLGQMGMAGTSAAGGAAMGVARRRTESLGRLEERLRGERLGLSERLSGETMQARAGALEFGLGLGRETLGAQAGALELGLGLTEQRLGFGTEAMGYMTDLESRRLGALTQLGGAGLEYGDVAWQNLMGERERLTMMPWEARRQAWEDWERMNVGGQIVRQPPYPSGSQELWGAAGTSY